MALVLDGLANGLQLALLAVGLTLVYGLGGVLNLAHGQVAVLAGITTAVALDAAAPPALALATGLAVAVAVVVAADVTVMRAAYARRGEARVLRSLLLTLGLAFTIDGLLALWQPFAALSLRIAGGPIDVLGVPMRRSSLAASALALAVLVALATFLRHTRHGRAVRATIEDEQGAQLCGIDTARVRTAVVALSAALAGVAAAAEAMTSSVGVADGTRLTTLALIVTVVGGLGSVVGTLAAGVLLGLVSTLGQALIGGPATLAVLLATAMVALLVRPAGLVVGRG